jgi:hypothetical protein
MHLVKTKLILFLYTGLAKKNYNKSLTFKITFITILPYHVSIHHVIILKRKLFSTDSNVRCFCLCFHGSPYPQKAFFQDTNN